jgi:DNA-binding XRE family transcriptional regulator
MGKAKARAKNQNDENEFLNDLINEIKLDEDSDDEVSDDSDSLSERFSVLSPDKAIKNDKPIKDPFKSIYDSDYDSDDELPTAFANIKKGIKVEASSDQRAETPESSNQNRSNEKTIVSDPTAQTARNTETIATSEEPDRTVAVTGARGRQVIQEKVATGALKGTRNGQVYTSLDASLAQSETLKIAQTRIKELEIEVDRLRTENDDLASAGDIVTRRVEDLQIKLLRIEKEKADIVDQSRNEILILKGNLQYKETELSKTKAKLEDLEIRIKTDFRKIRVRERELENRLELVRGEKQALMRAKDEKILELQRKLDQYKSELDLYRDKVQDLNKNMESQQEQMQKTIRALRIAMINLENDELNESRKTSSSEEES